MRVLREWADNTLAARERFGQRFFKKSAAAYFIDNVQHASKSSRTPPDWWLELRNAERQAQAAEDRKRREVKSEPPAETILSEESRAVFAKVVQELFQQFQSAGQTPETARINAQRLAAEHVRRLSKKEKAPEGLANPLRGILPFDPSF